MSVNDSLIEEEQLPAWMRQAKRGIDWGAILIIGFAIIASWSYFEQGNLSAVTDNEAYVFRITDTAQAFREGAIYPRWSPYTLNGYGSPIPHYYPSGAVYIGGLINFLFSVNPITVLQGLYIFAFILAGSMVYTFVTQRTNALAGLVSGVLYLFSPHIISGIGQVMGDLPLAFGMALLPALLWATNRLLQRDQATDLLLIALIIFVIIVTVPVILFQGLIVIIILLIVEFSDTINYKKIFAILGAILLGGMLGAFYWIPALAHYQQILWYQPMINAPEHLINLRNIFSMTASINTQSAIPYPTFAIGWVILILQGVVLFLFIRDYQSLRLSLRFFILGFVLLLGIIWIIPTQASFIILVILCFSISGSGIVQYARFSKRVRLLISIGIISGTIILSIPQWVFPTQSIALTVPTPDDYLAYEQSGWGYAGLPAGDLLPSHLAPDIAYDEPIADSFTNDVDRIQTTQVTFLSEIAYSGRYRVNINHPLVLPYQRAYFKLWGAWIGDEQLEINQSNDNKIEITVPADTNNTISIKLASDNIIIFATVISILGFVIGITVSGYRLGIDNTSLDESVLLTHPQMRVFAGIMLITLFARGLVATSPELITERLKFEESPKNYERPFNIRESLQFIDFQDLRPVYTRGNTLNIQTIWSLEQATQTQFLVELRLVDSDTRTTAYTTNFDHIGYVPTNRWQSSVMLNHLYVIDLPRTLETGAYTIELSVFDCDVPCNRDAVINEQAISTIPLPATIIIN